MRQKPPYATFPNGSEVWFAGLEDNESGSEKILGNEFSTVFLNEASEVVLYSNYLKTLTRLAQKNGLRKLALIDENPPTKNHWTYKRFIDGVDPVSREPLDNLTKATLREIQINQWTTRRILTLVITWPR